MIDPVVSLAMAMNSVKGAYAVLLGSGVSRAAGIPTAWEILIDLSSKLAAALDERCEPDPAEWFKCKFGREPNYSQLIGQLGKTSTERGGLLKPYFEPTSDDLEEGKKQPTVAHRAIASLVRRGFYKSNTDDKFR